MAGWRASGKGGGEPVEPIELLDDDDRSEVEVGDARTVDWHARLRTGAAVVAALALVWLARSSAQERQESAQRSCASDVQQAIWRYENVAASEQGFGGPPRIPTEVLERLIEQARDCGDEIFADALEYEMEVAAERARERDTDR